MSAPTPRTPRAPERPLGCRSEHRWRAAGDRPRSLSYGIEQVAAIAGVYDGRRDRPFDSERGVVVANAPRGLGVMKLRYLVVHRGVVGQGDEPVRATLGDEQRVETFGGQGDAVPAPVAGR